MATSGKIVVALILVAGAGALNIESLEKVNKDRPVTRVVNLLKEMQTQLVKENDGDQELYDKFACWCETNDAAKTKAVADGISHDKQLQALTAELAAKSQQLAVDIEQLTKELTNNKAALAEATQIRAREQVEFRDEEMFATNSIRGLQDAVLALQKHHALPQESLLQLRKALALSGLTHAHKVAVTALLQHRGPAHLQEYTSQSGEIFGILKQMKEGFENNLANSQSEEKNAIETFQSVKAAKEQEISAAAASVEQKKVERASTDAKNADAKEDLEDTRNQVTADQAFVLDLQERCGSMDKMWADRQTIRQEEQKAVNEALKILMDDDAHDLFSRSTGFLQLKSRSQQARQAASRLLDRVAQQTRNSELSMIAVSMQNEVFAKIAATVQTMMEQLKVEQEDDVVLRDQCTKELQVNERQTQDKYSEKSDLQALLEDLQLQIRKLSEDIEAAQAEASETQVQMKIAEGNREKENGEFQAMVTDQRATQATLSRALDKLKAFYEAEAPAAVLAQETRRSTQAPPPVFEEYKKQDGGVLTLISHLIDESKQAENEAIAAETEAQADYISFIKDSKTSIANLLKSITDKSAAKAKADADRLRAEHDLSGIDGDITILEDILSQTHHKCDFLLKNFEVRQAARTTEMEALKQSIAVLSGAEE